MPSGSDIPEAQAAAGAALPPGVASALATAALRVATPCSADLIGTAAGAVAAVRASTDVSVLSAPSASATSVPGTAGSAFVATAAEAVAAGRADAGVGPVRARTVGFVPTLSPVASDVRDAHAAATAVAGAVGRVAARASISAASRATSGAGAAGSNRKSAGRSADGGLASGGGRSARGRAAGHGELQGTLHQAVDVRMERHLPRAVSPTRPYMSLVPLQVLQSAETTRETLQQLCRERGIPFGVNDSGASLKASLVRCNAHNRTTWGARMMFMATYVQGEAQEDCGGMEAFHMAMAHPPGVRVDQPPVATDASAPFSVASIPSLPTGLLPPSSPCPCPSPARPPRCPPAPSGPELLPDAPPAIASPRSSTPSLPSPSRGSAPPPPSLGTPSYLDRHHESGTLAPSSAASPPPPIASVSGELLPSSHHAALMMQSFAAEQAVRVNVNVSHFNELRGMVVNIATAVSASAQSAAASSNRLDGAMAKVVAGNTEVTTAMASIKASAPHLYAAMHRPSKRAKQMAGGSGRVLANRGGVADTHDNGSGGSGTATGDSGLDGYEGIADDGGGGAASAKVLSPRATPTYYYDVVHNITIPPEMVTDTLKSEPLFNQLRTLLTLCHVSTGNQGLFGSLAVNGLYQDGVKRTKEMRSRGGVTGTINAAKTVRMTNIVKNKVTLYLRQLYWMHSVVPTVIKQPHAASFDNMKSAELGEDEQKALAEALRRIADEDVLAPNHALRDPIKATSSVLRDQLKKMSGRPGTTGPINVILSSSPFRELLAEAEKNVKAKYK